MLAARHQQQIDQTIPRRSQYWYAEAFAGLVEAHDHLVDRAAAADANAIVGHGAAGAELRLHRGAGARVAASCCRSAANAAPMDA